MKKIALMIAGLGIAVSALPATASAQQWQNINSRQANIEQRLNTGIRNGALTRPEATRLRTQFRNLNGLEQQYRRSGGGLTQAERRDLDRRFDALSQRVRTQKNDRQGRR
ncbi:hypothetical protein [Sphingomonas qomolangmaensis]|uniref:Uncharacterized protein n=1 Tax=Sphingomonas qomolangmaensis TaxID=2918765 RepID=A0ABY5L580_9SPHN|nr:hypothetical protein [Sphingomonas qomolangmaensis]UUL81321.1 hypothetical protein NMP03_08800 [Sphingomonas qomolangmaensis]